MPDTELLPKSKPEPEPVRRLEVFTGTGRRRKWTAQQKAGIVAESYESGDSVSVVARRHGLTPQQQLFGWRRVAHRWAEGESGVSFAPVIVDRAGAVAASPRPKHLGKPNAVAARGRIRFAEITSESTCAVRANQESSPCVPKYTHVPRCDRFEFGLEIQFSFVRTFYIEHITLYEWCAARDR